jgi:Mrp family chromosome partitioning ATPase/capsular polysaccharide biosynthesis protein
MTTPRGTAVPGLLRTYAWLVVLTTLVAVGAAVVAAAARPISYTSTAEIVVTAEETEGTPLRPDMGTERTIARSGVVAGRAAAVLGSDPATAAEGLDVTVVLESSVLRISYSAATAEAALAGAKAFAYGYVSYRNGRAKAPVATLVTPAALPHMGTRGPLPVLLLLGLLAGLAVGVSASWVWDRLADRVRHPGELTRLTGLPVLTSLPKWAGTDGAIAPGGLAREPFAYLAARLGSLLHRPGDRTVVVTAPRARAGTTSVACGAAVALARQGKEVVLVAAHLEGLLPEEVLSTKAASGLRQLLRGECSLDQALHATHVPHLRVLPSGGEGPGRLELGALATSLRRLSPQSYVVIDAPPLLASADSLLLADLADAVVLVADLRTGTRADVREAWELLQGVEPGTVLGWIANRRPRERRRAANVEAVELSGAGPAPDQHQVSTPYSYRDQVPQGPPRRGRKPAAAPTRATPPHAGGRPAPGPAEPARPR